MNYYKKDNLEYAIDKAGRIHLTALSYARLSGKNYLTISARTMGKDLVPETTALEWLAQDNPERLILLAQTGLRHEAFPERTAA